MWIRETFHIMQDDLNWLQVKARLLSKWADRKILNEIIPKYEIAVHKILYPVIIE